MNYGAKTRNLKFTSRLFGLVHGQEKVSRLRKGIEHLAQEKSKPLYNALSYSTYMRFNGLWFILSETPDRKGSDQRLQTRSLQDSLVTIFSV